MLALSDAPEKTRVRVRVAVEDTADPVLAQALEHALDGELKPKTLERAVER